MTMQMGFGQHMEMRPSPSLIAFTEILQLSALELQQMILAEVAENPALELTEVEVCPACGDPLLADGTCYRCRRGEDLVRSTAQSLLEVEEEDRDLLTRVPDQPTLPEHLLLELATMLDAADLPIAEVLLGELDERGFLDIPPDLVAASLGVPLARVEAVLAALQAVGPLGIGARSVEECLRLQLDRWAELGVEHPLARELVDHHLAALGHGRYAQLAHTLGVSYEEVLAARDFIRTHLRPYPIAERSDLPPWDHQTGPGMIAPDVVVRLVDDGILVEVVESRRYGLTLNPLYRELAARIEAEVPAGAAALSTQDRRHIQDQVGRARQFLTHLRERRATMRRVAGYVMARQEAFLRQGPRHLEPLTRAEVAAALELHESTVSRATAGKHVLLPNRQLVPFATFFKAALSVQDVLRELIEHETHPLTDTELAAALEARGYKVARRTVAKYRDQMGVLPSSLR